MSIAFSLDDRFAALEAWGPVEALRDSTLAYPLVNALHIVGVALLFGSIVALDLRLIGLRRSAGPADGLARLLVPVAILGLALAVPAGLMLFSTDARAYAASPLFQAKLLLILLAIANALWFRSRGWRGGRAGALAGSASILLWLGAIVLGRMIGYF